MFYSNELLAFKKGKFSVVWLLGANLDLLQTDDGAIVMRKAKRIKLEDILAVRVSAICLELEKWLPTQGQHFSLRMISTLLAGISICHAKKTSILLADVRNFRGYRKRPK